MQFCSGIFDDLSNYIGDRNFRDDGAVIGRIELGDQTVTSRWNPKEKNLQDNLKAAGQPHSEGYRKLLRLMKQAEKFSRQL